MALQLGCGLEVLMMPWPADYNRPWTLASSVSRSGIGLHSGQLCQATLVPSVQEGFYLRWIDQTSQPVRLEPSQVRDSQLCTTLDFGDRRLSIGTGVIVSTPVGPLRLEVASQDLSGDWRFNLGVGWKF